MNRVTHLSFVRVAMFRANIHIYYIPILGYDERTLNNIYIFILNSFVDTFCNPNRDENVRYVFIHCWKKKLQYIICTLLCNPRIYNVATKSKGNGEKKQFPMYKNNPSLALSNSLWNSVCLFFLYFSVHRVIVIMVAILDVQPRLRWCGQSLSFLLSY